MSYTFTGKERDPESGLDNFGARYDSSSLGRFMRPDDPNVDQDPADPQSWRVAQTINRKTNLGGPHVAFTCGASDSVFFLLVSRPQKPFNPPPPQFNP